MLPRGIEHRCADRLTRWIKPVENKKTTTNNQPINIVSIRSVLKQTWAMEPIDLYSLLKVSRDATEEEIHKAYKSLSTCFHPDKLPRSTSPDKRERIQQIFLEFKRASTLMAFIRLVEYRKRSYFIFLLCRNR